MKKVTVVWTVLLILVMTPVAGAQNPAPTQRSQGSTPDFVEEKGFKTNVFTVQHRDPTELIQVLRTLGSGFKGAQMSASREFSTITVRDFPENIGTIAEALRRLDVQKPKTPKSSIEFTIQILLASNDATTTGEYPSSLNDVVKQLQTVLKYKNYTLMAAAIHRADSDPNAFSTVENSGVAETKLFSLSTPNEAPIFYQYKMQRITLETPSGPAIVSANVFDFSMRIPLSSGPGGQYQYQNVGFHTPVTLKEDDRVVVGTTTIADKGLIVVLSAKVLK